MADDAEAKSILVATTIEAAGSTGSSLPLSPSLPRPKHSQLRTDIASRGWSCTGTGRGSDGESGSEEPAHRLPATARGCRRAARRVCSPKPGTDLSFRSFDPAASMVVATRIDFASASSAIEPWRSRDDKRALLTERKNQETVLGEFASASGNRPVQAPT
jgi:hypothetical protein